MSERTPLHEGPNRYEGAAVPSKGIRLTDLIALGVVTLVAVLLVPAFIAQAMQPAEPQHRNDPACGRTIGHTHAVVGDQMVNLSTGATCGHSHLLVR